MNKKYNYFYKITNKINNHFYYGVHRTDDLNDGYMGSGSRLKNAFKKYGIENFEKEILRFFDTGKEAFEYEAEVVTEELVHDNNCYNMVCGGRCAFDNDFNIAIKNEEGTTEIISKDDPRYLSNDFVGYSKGMVVAKDSAGKIYRVSVNDSRYLSGELVNIAKGHITSEQQKNKLRKIQREFYKNHPICTVFRIDDNGECIKKRIYEEDLDSYINDGWEKYISKTTDNMRYINKDGIEKKVLRYYVDDYVAQGWTKGRIGAVEGTKNSGKANGHYGTVYIKRDIDGEIETMSVKKEELDDYLKMGWELGRYIGKEFVSKLIGDELVCKMVDIEEIDKYIADGWEKRSVRSVTTISAIVNGKRCRKSVSSKVVGKYLRNGWFIGKPSKVEMEKMYYENNISYPKTENIE